MTIRQAKDSDIDEILKLFYDTVTNVCEADYNHEQIKVWASSASQKQKWLNRISKQYFIVAEHDGKIVGFGSIEKGEYLDLLYVHMDYIRQGIATMLLMELEKESDKHHKACISADVSITAKPFFEKHGFKVIQQQTKLFNNVEITNYKMIKEKATVVKRNFH
jgi:putative acetyltransferase